MDYKRFYVNCIVRVVLMSATVCLAAFLIFRTQFYATPAVICLAAVYQVFELVRYVSRTNRDLTRFLLSIKHSDFSQSFTSEWKGSGFEALNAAFTDVIRQFQRTKIEKEEHFRYLQTIIDHVGIGLLAYNSDGEVDLINNAARRMLKIPQLRNLEQLESISPKLSDALLHLAPGESRLVRFQQEDNLLQLSIYATGFILRKRQMILVSIQNIQGELEEKEMEAWQNLIRVLTHEIMNSITPISSLASTANDLLRSAADTDEMDASGETIGDVREAVSTIEKRSKGLLTFINSYRELTRIPKPDFEIVSVRELFERIHTLMLVQLGQKSIDFQMRTDPESLEITADPALIEQVLINLCNNAVEALEGKESPKIELTAGMDGFGNPVIRVADNGKGIRDEIVEKIFIPFFTTKQKGSGIGLSLSRQIMRLHKGTLSVRSTPGMETVFTLRF